MTVHLVGNTKATTVSRSDEAAYLLRELLAKKATIEPGFDGGFEHHKTETPDQARELLAELVQRKAERVIVMGGDGSVQLAANELANTQVPLGVLRGGTGNDFASSIDVPKNLEAACKKALAPARKIDLIEATPISAPTRRLYATTVMAAGYSTQVTLRAASLRKFLGKWCYFAAGVVELFGLDTVSGELVVDGESLDIETNVLALANTSQFGAGMKVAPNASPTDGELDVVLLGPVSRLDFAWTFPKAFRGTHLKHKRVTVMRAKEVLVNFELPFIADGELWPEGPYLVKAANGALGICGY